MRCYRAMLERLGPSRWWPGDSPFEVAVGAVLTQNTAWSNVEKALARLRAAGALSPLALWRMPIEELEEALRPSVFFRQKTKRLRNLLACFACLAGSTEPPDDIRLEFLQSLDDAPLRAALLAVTGIGPETADAVLLYALGRPSFTADAYTRRIFSRHGLLPADASYETIREYFMSRLPADVALYNEYHALIVRTGKEWCKKNAPLCAECPLGPLSETVYGRA